MKIDAFICNSIPFKQRESKTLRLFYRVTIHSQHFSIQISANNMQNQKIRIINFFDTIISCYYIINYIDGTHEKVVEPQKFNDTFTITVERNKRIKNIIYNFHLNSPKNSGFETIINCQNF